MTKLSTELTTNKIAPVWNVRGENVRIPAGDRRNPIVFLDLMIGQEWGITVAMQSLKCGVLMLRMPSAPDGGPGVRPCPALQSALERAAAEAVAADPVALAHLNQPHPAKRRKVGGKRPKTEEG